MSGMAGDRLDDVLRSALSSAGSALEAHDRPLGALREKHLRGALHAELTARLPGRVRKESKLTLGGFQGVGGFDLRVDGSPGGPVEALAEVKWSYTERPKVFEAVWDAVKLALAQDELGVRRGWLITGAPGDVWPTAECRELFESGTVDVTRLWECPLKPPGPNGGATAGDDLKLGGHGNMFTRAPARLVVAQIAEQSLRHGAETWLVKAASVVAAGEWIEAFAPPPQFPAVINDTWLKAHVPTMSQTEFDQLIAVLRRRKWTAVELETRVFPLHA